MMANLMYLWEETRERVMKEGLVGVWKNIPDALNSLSAFAKVDKDPVSLSLPSPRTTSLKRQASAKPGRPNKKQKSRVSSIDVETETETGSSTDESEEEIKKKPIAVARKLSPKKSNGFSPRAAVKRKPFSSGLKSEVATLREEVNQLNTKIDKIFKILGTMTKAEFKN